MTFITRKKKFNSNYLRSFKSHCMTHDQPFSGKALNTSLDRRSHFVVAAVARKESVMPVLIGMLVVRSLKHPYEEILNPKEALMLLCECVHEC